MVTMRIEIAFQPFREDGANWTLGHRLMAELASGRYNDFLAGVAFVTSSGTTRMAPAVRSFIEAGGRARVVFGIGNRVTSRQAAEHLNTAGASVRGIAPGPGLLFHQKVFRLIGPDAGLLIVGSNNLTADGMFRHFEGACLAELNPDDDGEGAALRSLDRHLEYIERNHPKHVYSLASEELDDLVREGLLRDETVSPPSEETSRPDDTNGETESVTSTGPRISVPAPPPPNADFPIASPGRTSHAPKPSKRRSTEIVTTTAATTPKVRPRKAPVFVVQIRPHHNGEIFLSTSAANEEPEFFGMPFTGTTTPKKAGNPAYPKRDPDPHVDLAVFDATGSSTYRLTNHEAYLYDYGKKSDLRLNLRDPIYKEIEPDSILVMSLGERVEYVLEVWAPGSTRYEELLEQCTTQMPSGGSGTGRRYGWL